MRRRLFVVGGLALALPARADTALPWARDLRASVAQAAARGEPVVLVFTLPDCPYCERVRRDTYRWLVRDGHCVLQAGMRAEAALVDFDGVPTSGRRLAGRFGVTLAPTALFLGPGGIEVADRLVGAGQPDFYGGQVDSALAQASARLRGGRT
jgi:thiol-disulfide isomerase/thioredoxin